MIKVVYNGTYGGFSLSREATEMYLQRKGIEYAVQERRIDSPTYILNKEKHFYVHDVPRHDPDLVAVVEELGSDRASGYNAFLCIGTIEGNQYRIEEYDGAECVIEPSDQEWITVEE
jgi:hypothetical protein